MGGAAQNETRFACNTAPPARRFPLDCDFPAIAVLIALAMVFTAAPATSLARSPVQEQEESVRALAVQFVDGRTNYRVLRPSGGSSWTTWFPRVEGAVTTRGGMPLSALGIDHAVEGRDVVATVFLLYGRLHEERVTVATVRVAEGPVRVDELPAYGVEAISLSVVPVPRGRRFRPAVIAPSGQVEVVVEPVVPDAPVYRIVVLNRSPHALMAFQYEGYEGERLVFSGRRKSIRHEPLAQPGETYVYELPGGGHRHPDDSPEWNAVDRLVVTSVIWKGGLVEGDPAPAVSESAVAAGAAPQLRRVLSLLGAARGEALAVTPDLLSAQLAELSVDVDVTDMAELQASLRHPRVLPGERLRDSMRRGMQQVKDAVLADLDELARTGAERDSRTLRRWLLRRTREYERWLERAVDYTR